MERIHIHLTPKQLKAVHRYAKNTGLPVAEVFRRALDWFLDAKLPIERAKS